MAFKRIAWYTGDLVDVTRLNQYYFNDQYVSDMFSKQIIISDPTYREVSVGSDLNVFYIKFDGTQLGGVASGSTSGTYYRTSCVIGNLDITSKTDGSHTITPFQGSNQTPLTFIKTSGMNYLTVWVDITKWDGRYGRMNYTLLAHNQPVSI